MTNTEMNNNEALKNISSVLNATWYQANACKLLAGDLEKKIITQLQGHEDENELEEYARTLRDMLELITDCVAGATFDVEQLTD